MLPTLYWNFRTFSGKQKFYFLKVTLKLKILTYIQRNMLVPPSWGHYNIFMIFWDIIVLQSTLPWFLPLKCHQFLIFDFGLESIVIWTVYIKEQADFMNDNLEYNFFLPSCFTYSLSCNSVALFPNFGLGRDPLCISMINVSVHTIEYFNNFFFAEVFQIVLWLLYVAFFFVFWCLEKKAVLCIIFFILLKHSKLNF